MNEKEFNDLQVLKFEIQTIKNNCFDYLKLMNKWSKRELEMSGYRNMTNAEAMQKAFVIYQERIEKLSKEYIKKYPDSK